MQIVLRDDLHVENFKMMEINMIRKLLKEMEDEYVSPTLYVTQFSENDVVRTSDFTVGEEEFDVNGSAVPFD